MVQLLLRRSVFLAACFVVSATILGVGGLQHAAVAQNQPNASSKLACRTKCPGGAPPVIREARDFCSETASDSAYFCRSATGKMTFCDCLYQKSEAEETPSYEDDPKPVTPPEAESQD